MKDYIKWEKGLLEWYLQNYSNSGEVEDMRQKTSKRLIFILCTCMIVFLGSMAVSAVINSVKGQPAKKITESTPTPGNTGSKQEESSVLPESSGTDTQSGDVSDNSNEGKTDGSSSKDTGTTSKDSGSTSTNTSNTSKGTGSTSGNTGSTSGNGKDAFAKYTLENATYVNSAGLHIVKNPDDILVLVNKVRNLTSDYVPSDMVKVYGSEKKMRKVAADALKQLLIEAGKEGMHLAAISGYRSYDTQKRIFQSNVDRYGEKEANKVSAYPGQSEHQTGLAMDVSDPRMSDPLIESFGSSAEGKWLKQNAADYGFIIRYPKGKESITGYVYEPWHIRYVGKDIAREIMSQGLTLEEYFHAVDKTYN